VSGVLTRLKVDAHTLPWRNAKVGADPQKHEDVEAEHLRTPGGGVCIN
jgi:hypothetical protein